ncbi:MAG: RecQ family ATP-dependent DNA helicase [Flavobacteriaceae bacterium]|nr:RecQ family ATP-dependent DNA helicase [Flavobacteriaceae bacterium]
MQHPIEILERYWNFTNFKPLQEEIINSVLEGNDTFALLPTGGGKSICFQIPALAKEGICIVVSPLIALMKDQVQALSQKDIKAMALTSEYGYSDISRLLDNCIHGNYKFLYLSPERLQQELVQERIKQMNVNLIAVDEAHCISQWGNDFRPAYKNITLLRELLPSVNIIALTASATKPVVTDIIEELDFINHKVFKQSFVRENLAYMVFEAEDKFYKIEQILKKNKSSSIIYVRNRQSTLDISHHLNNLGFTSTIYHGGLSHNERNNSLYQWKNNQKQVMVATNAFGMGIDKSDVKTVIHVNLPESLESYFQEAGRAGRNGKKAYAVILKNKGDESVVKNQFLGVLPELDFIKTVYRKLCNYFQISFGEGEFTTHSFNFSEFCKTYKFSTLITYNTLQILDRCSVISLTKNYQKQTTIQIIVNNKAVFNYIEHNQKIAIILKTILRTYGGVFDFPTKINTILVSDKANAKEENVIQILKQLEKDQVISLSLKNTDAEITFLVPREDDSTINQISHTVKQQNQLKEKQVHSVINYINNDTECNSIQLLSYFGEEDLKPCGICSVCISKKTTNKENVATSIDKIKEILKNNEYTSRELSQLTKLKEINVTKALKHMLELNIIKITNHNTYKLK